jgi:hypothetical protein
MRRQSLDSQLQVEVRKADGSHAALLLSAIQALTVFALLLESCGEAVIFIHTIQLIWGHFTVILRIRKVFVLGLYIYYLNAL